MECFQVYRDVLQRWRHWTSQAGWQTWHRALLLAHAPLTWFLLPPATCMQTHSESCILAERNKWRNKNNCTNKCRSGETSAEKGRKIQDKATVFTAGEFPFFVNGSAAAHRIKCLLHCAYLELHQWENAIIYRSAVYKMITALGNGTGYCRIQKKTMTFFGAWNNDFLFIRPYSSLRRWSPFAVKTCRANFCSIDFHSTLFSLLWSYYYLFCVGGRKGTVPQHLAFLRRVNCC